MNPTTGEPATPGDPWHHVTGGECWCRGRVMNGVIPVHNSLAVLADIIKEQISSACCGEDPGGDTKHWLEVARVLANAWWADKRRQKRREDEPYEDYGAYDPGSYGDDPYRDYVNHDHYAEDEDLRLSVGETFGKFTISDKDGNVLHESQNVVMNMKPDWQGVMTVRAPTPEEEIKQLFEEVKREMAFDRNVRLTISHDDNIPF